MTPTRTSAREPGLPVVGTGAPSALTDRHARTIRYLRVSVTDRCNYRCAYCMPAEGWATSPRAEVLRLEEIVTLVGHFAALGVERIRLTGGEPLVRRGIVELVRQIAAVPGIREVAMTTNGHLLPSMAAELYAAGLRGLNVSLDSLDPHRFATLTRGGDLARVLAGLDAAASAGFQDIKVNAVVVAGQNDDELADLAEFCWERDIQPRFIELMPIGQLEFARPENVVTTDRMLAHVGKRYHLLPSGNKCGTNPRGPAKYWRVTEGRHAGRRLGIISPLSDDGFCATCNRGRLTSLGGFRPCLGNDEEISLRDALRGGRSAHEIETLIREAVHGKLAAHNMHDVARAPRDAMTGIGG